MRSLAKAKSLAFVDSTHADIASCVQDADLVILATPVGTYAALAQQMASHLKPGAIVSDVGSVKGAVVRDIAPHIPAGVHFVPAHPIAGTERSGPEAGFAELFDGRWCILTPPEGADPAAVANPPFGKNWQQSRHDGHRASRPGALYILLFGCSTSLARPTISKPSPGAK